jgi:hypothetical protein
VALIVIAVVISLFAGPLPHVIYRVPLALITVWGLWRARRWVYFVAWINAAVWLFIFIPIVPLLLVAAPWVLWLPWLYWIVPTTLVLAACVLMSTAAGRAERAKWVRTS